MIEKLCFESAQATAHSQLTNKLNELITLTNDLEERVKKLEKLVILLDFAGEEIN